MSETRADTTSMGLFVISFFMLMFGITGIFGWSESEYFNGLAAGTVPVILIATIIFAFITYTAWKADNKFGMIIFGLLTLFHFAYVYVNVDAKLGGSGAEFIFIVCVIFFWILAFIAILNKAGWLLTALLITASLVFLFYALVNNLGDTIYWLLLAVFAFASFVLSLWLALADNTNIGIKAF